MLTLKLLNKDGESVSERAHEQEAYLAFKNRVYEPGDTIILETSKVDCFVWVQVDEALAPSLLYLKEKRWEFPVILSEELRRAYSPKVFSGTRHYIRAWLPREGEVNGYRNLAFNAHDQKQQSQAYPHAFANVETRNDSTFFARNAIDGLIANESHGSFPYQSWGINQQADAQLTIDFGRKVRLDKVALILRADYPHDSYWTEATLVFDGEKQQQLKLTNKVDRQYFSFSKIETTRVILKNLIKHQDESPFPALTQLEIFGMEVEEQR